MVKIVSDLQRHVLTVRDQNGREVVLELPPAANELRREFLEREEGWAGRNRISVFERYGAWVARQNRRDRIAHPPAQRRNPRRRCRR